MGKRHYFDDGTYFDEEIGEIVDDRNISHTYTPSRPTNVPTPIRINYNLTEKQF